jgi:hypothetical protein
MGGDIQVQSKLGIGTTATFDIIAQISEASFYPIPVFSNSVDNCDLGLRPVRPAPTQHDFFRWGQSPVVALLRHQQELHHLRKAS